LETALETEDSVHRPREPVASASADGFGVFEIGGG